MSKDRNIGLDESFQKFHRADTFQEKTGLLHGLFSATNDLTLPRNSNLNLVISTFLREVGNEKSDNHAFVRDLARELLYGRCLSSAVGNGTLINVEVLYEIVEFVAENENHSRNLDSCARKVLEDALRYCCDRCRPRTYEHTRALTYACIYAEVPEFLGDFWVLGAWEHLLRYLCKSDPFRDIPVPADLTKIDLVNLGRVCATALHYGPPFEKVAATLLKLYVITAYKQTCMHAGRSNRE